MSRASESEDDEVVEEDVEDASVRMAKKVGRSAAFQ